MRLAFIVLVALVTGCIASGPYGGRGEQSIARMCSDPRASYEAGYNSGMQRQPINSAWVDSYCAPQAREGLRQAYVAGYQAGTETAPQYATPVYAPAYPTPYGYAAAGGPAPSCELNSDGSRTCGYNCRLGSDGYHYCASTPAGRCELEAGGSFACP